MGELTKRRYDNRLRSKRAQRTRRRILDAVVEQLADESADDLSVAAIAQRAEVSEPTVYRHFPNREAIWDALADHFDELLDTPELPTDAAGYGSYAERVFPLLDKQRAVVRASHTAPLAMQAYRHARRARRAHLEQLLTELTEGLDEQEAKGVVAVLRLLNGSLAWRALDDEHGLDGSASGAAASWATQTLLAEVRRMQARKRDGKHERRSKNPKQENRDG